MRKLPIAFALSAMLSMLVHASALEAKNCPNVDKFEPGVVSTDALWEWRLSFDPTRTRAYWATSTDFWPVTREQSVIRTSTRGPGGWTAPVVASFSGEHADFDPFVSPDGSALYFSSMRPVDGLGKADMDLWVARRTAEGGWGEPEHLGDGPNIDGWDELYPSIDLQGNLYFARVEAPVPFGDVDIWRSRRLPDGTFGPAERLGPQINTPERWEFNPEVSPDGHSLLFVRLDLPDELPDAGHGFGDLYVARRPAGGDFGAGVNLGGCVNTEADEFHPTVLWERGKLFFARSVDGTSDFFETRLRLP